MVEWQMWTYISAMMVIGWVCQVGVRLHVFALAAALAAGSALLGFALDSQLQVFLGATLAGFATRNLFKW